MLLRYSTKLQMGTTRARPIVGAGTMKPNFFIVGAPKCGTTAWYDYLRSHPDIYFPEMKEPCFFALDLPNFRMVQSQSDYEQLFAPAGGARVIGDASAVHLMSAAAPKAIHDYNPDAKILILLRDQEQFLPSFHNQLLWEFQEEIENFERAWRLSGSRSAADIPPTCTQAECLDYRAMGRFGEQVQRYLARFRRDQVMVVRFDEWAKDPRSAYLGILHFLGLEDDRRTDFTPAHPGMTYRSRRLARLISHPPERVRRAWRLVRRATGIGTQANVRLAEKVTTALSLPGYNKKMSPALRNEIRAYYERDNELLNSLLAEGQRAAGVAPLTAATP